MDVLQRLRELTGAHFVEEGQAVRQVTLDVFSKVGIEVLYHNTAIQYFMNAPTQKELLFPISRILPLLGKLEAATEGYERAAQWLDTAHVAPSTVDVHERYLQNRLRVVRNEVTSPRSFKRKSNLTRAAMHVEMHIADYGSALQAYHSALERNVLDTSQFKFYHDAYEIADTLAMQQNTKHEDTVRSRVEVVASALAFSLRSKPTAILANDPPLVSMLEQVVSNVVAAPNAKYLKDQLCEYPIRLYATPGAILKKRVDTRLSPRGRVTLDEHPYLESAIQSLSRAVFLASISGSFSHSSSSRMYPTHRSVPHLHG